MQKFTPFRKTKNPKTIIVGRNSLSNDSDYAGELTNDSILCYVWEQNGSFKLGQALELIRENRDIIDERITPYDAWVERYRSEQGGFISKSSLPIYHGSLIFHRKDFLKIRNNITKSDERIDDIVRRNVRRKFKDSKCSFSANHFAGHRTEENPNKENLINFEGTDSQWDELIKIGLEMMGLDQDTNTAQTFVEKAHQVGDVDLVKNILIASGKCLLAGFTSYGKTIISLKSIIDLADEQGGGLILITSPMTDTLDNVPLALNNIKFTDREVIYIDKKNQNKYKTPKIKSLIKQGKILIGCFSVQRVRLDNDGLKALKRFTDLKDFWIRDEKWTEYGGPKTQLALAKLEQGCKLLDLGATVNKIKDDYLPSQIVSRDIFWAMMNRHLTDIPKLGIDVINFGANKLIDDLEDICGLGDGYDPRKLFIPNKEQTDFKHRSSLESIPDLFYGDDPRSSRYGMSIIDDRQMSEFSKRAGLMIMPEGDGEWGAKEYLPLVVAIWNKVDRNGTYYIDGYTFRKNKDKEAGGDSNRYMEDLLQIHKRVVIVTHRVLTVGTSIDWLGHCILFDKFRSDDFLEQGPIGRIVRKLIIADGDQTNNLKEWVKIKVLTPGLSIQETLLKAAIKSADNEDNVKLIAKYFDLFNLRFYEGPQEPKRINGQDLMEQICTLRLANKGARINSLAISKYLADEEVLKHWESLDFNIKFNGKGEIQITDENESNYKKNQKNDKRNGGKPKNIITPDKIRKLIDETFKIITMSHLLESKSKVEDILDGKVVEDFLPKSLLKIIKSDIKLKAIMEQAIKDIMKDSSYVDQKTMAKALLTNGSFTNARSMAFMPFDFMRQELSYIEKHISNPIIIYNPLNGSMVESVIQKFPDRRVLAIDTFGIFNDHLTKSGCECYNTIEEILNMNKKPVLIINAPYTDGKNNKNNIYASHLRNAINKLDPVAVINYSPDNLLTGVVNPNKSLRDMMIARYGNPTLIKFLNRTKDWKKMIDVDTVCTVFDGLANNTLTKIISRNGQKEFECELKGMIFPCESKEEYEWICSIQTNEKIVTHNSGKPTGGSTKEIKLQKNNKFELEDGKEYSNHNDCYRTAVGYQRTRCLVSTPPGVGICHSYRYMEPTRDKLLSEKFTRYMLSQPIRYLVKLRYNTRTFDSPAMLLVPKIDLNLLPDNFTDDDVFKLFNTPSSVRKTIEQIGHENPY